VKPPARIKVGHLSYEVALTPAADMGDNNADVDHEDLMIRINAALAPGAQAEKLVHEALHCCWDSWKIGPRWGEEKVVTALAPAMCAVIRDNPELVAWLQWTLSEGEG